MRCAAGLPLTATSRSTSSSWRTWPRCGLTSGRSGRQPVPPAEVRVSTDTRVRGLDGKSYPGRALTRQERGQAIRLAHQLVHERHLSIRAARRVMAQAHGVWRSVGSIAADLDGYEC